MRWRAFRDVMEKGNETVPTPKRNDPEGSQARVADNEHKTQFPAGTTRDQVIERMIKIIQTAASAG
jgi:hypothetical protein